MLHYDIDLCQNNHTVWWFAGTVFQCWLGYCVLTHVSIPQNLIWSNNTACEPLKSKCCHTLLKTWSNKKKFILSSFFPHLPSLLLHLPLGAEKQYYREAVFNWKKEKIIFGGTTLDNPREDAVSQLHLGERKLQFQARTDRAYLILAAELSKRRISNLK